MALNDLIAAGGTQTPSPYQRLVAGRQQGLQDALTLMKAKAAKQQMSLRDLQMQEQQAAMAEKASLRDIYATTPMEQLPDKLIGAGQVGAATQIENLQTGRAGTATKTKQAGGFKDILTRWKSGQLTSRQAQAEMASILSESDIGAAATQGIKALEPEKPTKAPVRKTLTGTEQSAFSSQIMSEDWWENLEGVKGKRSNNYKPTAAKGAALGTITTLANDLAQEYGVSPSDVMPQLIQYARQGIGINEGAAWNPLDKAEFDPIVFEEYARNAFSEQLGQVDELPTGLTEEDIQANMAQGYTREEVIQAYRQAQGQ